MGPESFYTIHPAGEDEFITPERELAIVVEQQANYKGNWTELLHTRVRSAVTRQKFLDMKKEFPTEETRDKDAEMGRFERHADVPQDVYQHTIENYINNIEKVFSSTEYMTTEESRESGNDSLMPDRLGLSTGYGHEGLLFKDGKWQGRSLTNEEKTIVEAHEKAHGLFMELTNAERKFILSPFNSNQLTHMHRYKADEVVARMSQLKNYFGFTGAEKFTFEHLKYAHEHYVEDTGLDNNISNLIGAIVDVDAFLKVINTIAC